MLHATLLPEHRAANMGCYCAQELAHRLLLAFNLCLVYFVLHRQEAAECHQLIDV
jgi:hypothetical protein